MVTRKHLYVACLVSLAAGLSQLLLAWWGNLLWDTTWTRSADHVEVPLFGYFATFNWWVPYITVVPVMVGSSVYALTTMRWLCDGSQMYRRGLLLSVLASVALPSVMVVREIVRSLTLEPTDWAQWNELRTQQPLGSAWLWQCRLALYLLGYFHYFVAYALSVACVTGALVASMTLRVPSLMAARDSVMRRLSDVLLSVRIVVAGYLFYLVLLRSSKVSMWLTSRGEAPALDKIYEFVTNARPYFEASREGVLVNIVLGFVWALTCVVTHVFSASIIDSSGQSNDTTLEGILHRIKTGVGFMGTRTVPASFWIGFFGICLLGIVLPPPTGWHFIAVLGTVIGVFLVRRAFAQR